jgi:DNA-binding MarR family transcriptional regulator
VARLTTEGLVGGALSVIHGRLVQPQDGRLTDLHGQLMALIVLPHLGARAAGEELARPLPDLARPRTGPAQDEDGRLLERLNMRFTYRTLRCLIFLSEHPASSNREVAKGAEISDEGQASKLLARLVKLELIANRRPPGPGTPNRWSLTRYGEQVMRTLRGS